MSSFILIILSQKPRSRGGEERGEEKVIDRLSRCRHDELFRSSIQYPWCLRTTMGANIAAFSHGRSSFTLGLRKRQTRAGMFHRIDYSNQLSPSCVCVCVSLIECSAADKQLLDFVNHGLIRNIFLEFRYTFGSHSFQKSSTSTFNRRNYEMHAIFQIRNSSSLSQFQTSRNIASHSNFHVFSSRNVQVETSVKNDCVKFTSNFFPKEVSEHDHERNIFRLMNIDFEKVRSNTHIISFRWLIEIVEEHLHSM